MTIFGTIIGIYVLFSLGVACGIYMNMDLSDKIEEKMKISDLVIFTFTGGVIITIYVVSNLVNKNNK